MGSFVEDLFYSLVAAFAWLRVPIMNFLVKASGADDIKFLSKGEAHNKLDGFLSSGVSCIQARNETIRLNVGGLRYEVSRDTLTRYKKFHVSKSYFREMERRRW